MSYLWHGTYYGRSHITSLYRPCGDHYQSRSSRRRQIVVGAVGAASPDPIPIVLLPGFEYRMREWGHPDTHEMHWRLERKRSARYGDNDE